MRSRHQRISLLLWSCLWAVVLGGCGVGRVYTGLGGTPGGSIIGAGAGNTSGTGSDDPSNGTAPTPAATTPAIATTISPDAPGCGRGQIAPATKTPVHFVFTLDRSGSMNDTSEAQAANRPTKWQALQAALQAVFEDLGAAADAGDNSVAVGVNYFGEATSGGSGTETGVELPIAALDRARANALKADIAGRGAAGATPTEAALSYSYDALAAFTPSTGPLANGLKVNVLVSDGKPNPAPATASVIPDLISSKRTGPPPVRTFSIGIGEIGSSGRNGYAPGFMSVVADRGGTGKPGCDPNEETDQAKFCHFQVTPSASASITTDLINAFKSIRDQVRSCELPLTIQKPNELEPRAVIVVAEKAGVQRVLVKDPVNGWTFDNETSPSAIRLNGAECDALRQNQSEKVFAILGCVCTGATSTGSPVGGGESQPGPGRSESTPGATAGEWNTNWCSYPFAVLPPGDCLGEGCSR